jgi:hypothetical protein
MQRDVVVSAARPHDAYGTVGTFMMSLGDLYAIAAGHVINNAPTSDCIIKHRITGKEIRGVGLQCRHPDPRDGDWKLRDPSRSAKKTGHQWRALTSTSTLTTLQTARLGGWTWQLA